MSPRSSRWIRERGVMSTILTSSASLMTRSGTVSRTQMPVISCTVSLRLSRCWTFMVVATLMPLSRIASTSCQRFSRSEPGTLVCASSSTSTHCGWRAMMASVSISSNVAPRYVMALRGTVSRPATCSSVPLRPCVSTYPMTTSWPRCVLRRFPSFSISYVLPTPAAKPRKIFRRPRGFSSRITRASSSSGVGRRSFADSPGIRFTPVALPHLSDPGGVRTCYRLRFEQRAGMGRWLCLDGQDRVYEATQSQRVLFDMQLPFRWKLRILVQVVGQRLLAEGLPEAFAAREGFPIRVGFHLFHDDRAQGHRAGCRCAGRIVDRKGKAEVASQADASSGLERDPEAVDGRHAKREAGGQRG